MSYPIEGVVKPTILVVDDTPDNLSLMRELLRKDYQVQLANGGERALKLAAMQPQPDLILLDIMMPVMDGYEVCRRLKADAATRDIPVVFLTAKADVEDEKRGLELGAVDYITKPISPPVVLARVKIHLALKAHADFLRDKSDFLEAEVSKRTREVLAIQDVTILAMASLAETLAAALPHFWLGILLLTVFGRFLKVYVYMSIAPVPLAFFAGGNVTAMYGRNYIKNVFGVCMEAVTMVIAIQLFCAIADDAVMTQVGGMLGFLGTMAKPVMLLLYLSSLSAIIKGADNMTHKLLGFV